MTRKQFEKKRRHLLFILMSENKRKELAYNFKELDKLKRPNFSKSLVSYQQCWEQLSPLRQALNYEC